MYRILWVSTGLNCRTDSTSAAEANAGRFHYVVAMGMRIIKALHGTMGPDASMHGV